jgi:bifunctional UDP-N-acetylglucosamine pyrophosphorylase / glucosamine-1-phosphate N-acetyltransferase
MPVSDFPVIRVVILAAGKGTRMRSDLPKALVPVGEKPILQYLLESVAASELDPKPIVVIGHERKHICEAFGARCDYAVQEFQKGTAHAVLSAKKNVGAADAVVVLYGDHPFVSPGSLRRLAKRHLAARDTLTLMTTTVPSFNGWYRVFQHWGRILRDGKGKIAGIREFKEAYEDERAVREVNPALMCFDARWLWDNIEKVRPNNSQGELYLTDLVALAFAQGQKIDTLEIAPEEAIGINSPEEKEIAEAILERKNGR